MQANTLKIKICGMRDPGNIDDIASLSPDYMGFIYYPGSKRFAGGLSPDDISGIPEKIRKTGVFVNSSREEVLSISDRMNFQAVQLHGGESPAFCRDIKKSGLELIKVFSFGMGDGLERMIRFSEQMEEYLEHCDLFLFDTAGRSYGGTGNKFDWTRLSEYTLEKGFFLSGGLAPGDLGEILELKHPQLFGIDLNSGFENEPGCKNPDLLAEFIRGFRKL